LHYFWALFGLKFGLELGHRFGLLAWFAGFLHRMFALHILRFLFYLLYQNDISAFFLRRWLGNSTLIHDSYGSPVTDRFSRLGFPKTLSTKETSVARC
jgi:hypothetical protein